MLHKMVMSILLLRDVPMKSTCDSAQDIIRLHWKALFKWCSLSQPPSMRLGKEREVLRKTWYYSKVMTGMRGEEWCARQFRDETVGPDEWLVCTRRMSQRWLGGCQLGWVNNAAKEWEGGAVGGWRGASSVLRGWAWEGSGTQLGLSGRLRTVAKPTAGALRLTVTGDHWGLSSRDPGLWAWWIALGTSLQTEVIVQGAILWAHSAET